MYAAAAAATTKAPISTAQGHYNVSGRIKKCFSSESTNSFPFNISIFILLLGKSESKPLIKHPVISFSAQRELLELRAPCLQGYWALSYAHTYSFEEGEILDKWFYRCSFHK